MLNIKKFGFFKSVYYFPLKLQAGKGPFLTKQTLGKSKQISSKNVPKVEVKRKGFSEFSKFPAPFVGSSFFSNNKLEKKPASEVFRTLNQQSGYFDATLVSRYKLKEFRRLQRFEGKRHFTTEDAGQIGKFFPIKIELSPKNQGALINLMRLGMVLLFILLVAGTINEEYHKRISNFADKLIKLFTIKSRSKLEQERDEWQSKADELEIQVSKLQKDLETYESLKNSKILYEKMKAFQEFLKSLPDLDIDSLKKQMQEVLDEQILPNMLAEERKRIEDEYQVKLEAKDEDIKQQKVKLALLENDGQKNLKAIEEHKRKISDLEEQKKLLESQKLAAIEKNKEYEKLQMVMKQILSGVELNVHDMKAIKEVWNQKACFKELALSAFGLQCIDVMMRQFWQNHSFQEVDFSNCYLNQYEAKMDFITKNLADSSIESLNLQHNYLHYKNGAKKIAQIIRDTKTIKTLVLNNNSLDDEDIKLIAEALKVNNSIEKLVLSTNSFGVTGEKYLSEAIEKKPPTTTIDMNGNWGTSSQIQGQGSASLTQRL